MGFCSTVFPSGRSIIQPGAMRRPATLMVPAFGLYDQISDVKIKNDFWDTPQGFTKMIKQHDC
jgi:hypothetical protein